MKAIIPLVVAMTFGVIGFSMVLPLLPYMLRLHGLSQFWQVAVFSVFSFVSFFASPLWGRLSDKIGRKPVILLALLGSAGCCLWLYFTATPVGVYANRAVAGLFAGWLAASQAYVGDWVGEKDRVRGMAMMGIAFGIGFSIGPLSSALLIDNLEMDWHGDLYFFKPPLLVAVVCYGLSALIVMLAVNDVPASPQKADEKKLSVPQVLAQPAIAEGLLLVILFQLVFTALESTLALWVFDSFNGGPPNVGRLLFVAGIASLITHGSIVGLGKRFHPMVLAIVGMCALSLALLSMLWAETQNQAYVVMVFAAIGHGLFVPACSGFLSRLAPAGFQGCVMGFMQSGNNLSRIGGPLGGGSLYSALGNRWTYVALLVPLIPTLILAYHLRRRKLL